MGKLKNDRHERFCQEYIIDQNATQAYIRTGYSEKTAQAGGSTLLSNPMVKERIEELQGKVSKKLEISAEMIGREFLKLGTWNMSDFVKEDGTLKDVQDLTRDQAAAISGIKMKTLKSGKGGTVLETELKFHSKEKSLEALGKHIGWFEAHNEQKHPKEDFSNLSTEELVKRAKAIKALEDSK